MILTAVLSTVHLLGLAVGLPAVYLRGRALKALAASPGKERLDAVLAVDNVWGIAALLWLVTGITRAFGGFEKGTEFYMHSSTFIGKMALFVGILLVELTPMVTFLGWRRRLARGQAVDTSRAGQLARLNDLEVGLTVVIPFLASLMARGVGAGVRWPWE